MKIEIVTHVYAETFPQYAVFLRAQLSSLLVYPPDNEVTITVCYCPEDRAVVEVLDDFTMMLPPFSIKDCKLDKGHLFRRAIGRNFAALQTKADVVWFTDVDHFFGFDCIDAVCRAWAGFEKKPTLFWPREVWVNKSYTEADQWWQSNLNSRSRLTINPENFELKRYNQAIGGVQIVDGDFARKHGYLHYQKKYQTPVSPDKPFPSFKDDVAYRAFAKSEMAKVPGVYGGPPAIFPPNLFRLRHGQTSYQSKVHK